MFYIPIMLDKHTSAQRTFKKTNRYPKSLYIIYDGESPIYVGVTQLPIKHRIRLGYRSDYINNNRDRLNIIKVGDINSPDDLIKETVLILFLLSIGYKLHNKAITPGAGVGGYKCEWSKDVPKKINGKSKLQQIRTYAGYKNISKYVSERDKDLFDKCIELDSKGYTQTKIGQLLGIRQDKVCRLLKKYK